MKIIDLPARSVTDRLQPLCSLLLFGVSFFVSCKTTEPTGDVPSVVGNYRYLRSDDVLFFAGEGITLTENGFEYGRFSDAHDDPSMKLFPMRGSYSVDGCLVTLTLPDRYSPHRILTWRDGRYLMWTPKQYQSYLRTKKIPVEVLYQTPIPQSEQGAAPNP